MTTTTMTTLDNAFDPVRAAEPKRWMPRFRAHPRREASTPETERPRLVVVGNGMVGQRLCERLAETEGTRRLRICVVGDEPELAYDRVHLSEVLRGKPAAALFLKDEAWWQSYGIEVLTGQAVTGVDRNAKTLTVADGKILHYDRLVFATGSEPRVPDLPGSRGRHVFVYRTLADVRSIDAAARTAREQGRRGLVVGGGLLGLEAARSLQQLGCPVMVIESASQLLPRQLDPEGANRLKQELSSVGLDVCLGRRLNRIDSTTDGVVAHFADGQEDAAFLVFATGVRPRDEVARRAGLRCHSAGGIVVDAAMRTSDSSVFAIGECARFEEVAYGVVAPGHAMAEVLAANLLGGHRRFSRTAVTTRLKVDGVEVSCLGDHLQDPQGSQDAIAPSNGPYRRLILRNRRIVAALSVGSWPQFPLLQEAIASGRRVKRRELRRFLEEGVLWPVDHQPPVASWPDRAVLCSCTGVSCGDLRSAKARGLCSSQALAGATGASTVCGTCKPLLEQFAGEREIALPRTASWPLLTIAALAIVFGLGFVLLPPVAYTQSVQAPPIDILWRHGSWRKATGFVLLGLMLLGMGLTAAKRFPKLGLGTFARWRVLHSLLGALTLGGLFFHTGMRLGQNLNFALVVAFIAASAFGALAAGVAALEPRLPGEWGPRLRRLANFCHWALLWPLPPLLAVHVFKAFYF